jgi:hypothetical protein
MSRTRLIKPAFFKHAELYQAEAETALPLRIAFAGLWTVADREGRFRWKSDLKPDILPYDPVDIMAVLDALERHGFVRSYVVDGKRYGVIPSFHEHQTFHKTERHSTLPAPLANGESTVRHTADTVTGTVAVTGTEKVVGGVVGVVIGEAAEYALQLTITANHAITAKWGEQATPLFHGQSYQLADDCKAAGVPLDTAKASIRQQCEKSGKSTPPKGINWFRNGILDAHQTAQQKALQGSAPKENTLERDAGEVWDKVRRLLSTVGEIRFIEREKIDALNLDKRAWAALGKVEGLQGIKRCPAEKLVWKRKDFIDAYRNWRPDNTEATA